MADGTGRRAAASGTAAPSSAEPTPHELFLLAPLLVDDVEVEVEVDGADLPDLAEVAALW
ncbi:hypothetical protein [Streptomyces sp. MP131-18]|uniref:hypothetical protein n=1 Tax=Streptomyces sp. MP131-18 TaxID=1857892 RepID=UPI00117F6BB1|nr:hypothetical protein [Streptomyces sp. MP131-18]